MKKPILIIIVVLTISSCFLNTKERKDIDPFYTKTYQWDFPVLPLAKPIFISYDKAYNEWFYEVPNYFKTRMQPSAFKEVGVEDIYGKKKGGKWNLYDRYKKGEYVFAGKYNGISRSFDSISKFGSKRINMVDSSKSTFIEPDRYYVMNVADSTTEAFFSEKKYNNTILI